MIITIDTSKDSQDDIKRAIALLSQIANGVGSTGYQNHSNHHNPPVNSAFDFSTPSSSTVNSYSQTSNSADQSTNGFAAMFGDMNSPANQVPVTSSLSAPLSNVAAGSDATKKKVKYDFETY